MLSQLDFNRIKVFYYIFSNQSVAKAARELNITQSAVSQQLKKLELEIKTRLFTRCIVVYWPIKHRSPAKTTFW